MKSRLLLFFLLLSSTCTAFAQGQSFSTIRDVKVSPLSNGVQITILSDGILQSRDADTNGQRMAITFPQARNGTGKNFFSINRYPVSYLQLSTPQGATWGHWRAAGHSQLCRDQRLARAHT
jgi:hypothetical protein